MLMVISTVVSSVFTEDLFLEILIPKIKCLLMYEN